MISFSENTLVSTPADTVTGESQCWKIMIVDDHPMTHQLAKYTLQSLVFEDKSLRFISAYSSDEARRLIETHPDTALILLDMVMEDEDSGLKIADYIRNTLENKLVRLILWTGTTEKKAIEKIIIEYDLNDYKNKVDLSPHEMVVTVLVSLKSYHDLMTLETNRRKLVELSVNLAAQTAELQSLNEQLEGEVVERKQIIAQREELLEAEHEQRLLAETLSEATLTLTSQLSQAAVLEEILGQMQRLVPYGNAHLMFLESQQLRIAAWRGYEGLSSERLIPDLVQSLTDVPVDAEAIRLRRPLVINNTHEDSRWVVIDGTSWIMSYAVVPIYLGDQAVGVLRLDADTPHAFSDKDIVRLQPLANAAAIALENARLYDQAQQEIAERKKAEKENQELLASISSILIGVNRAGYLSHWNQPAEIIFGLSPAEMLGRPLAECELQWDWARLNEGLADCRKKGDPVQLREVRYTRPDQKEGFLNININPFEVEGSAEMGFLLLGEDITERKILEAQLSQAQKLEAVGQLAAGIAHEINTPTQYIGDNINFLQDGLAQIGQVVQKCDDLIAQLKMGADVPTLINELEALKKQVRLNYLLSEMPLAVQDALEGVERVTKIVQAMKLFSHPGVEEKTAININQAIESTITVARNEWKYIADVETDFDQTLPPVLCLASEFNQVILNILINAAHAIKSVIKAGEQEKGKITITTRQDDEWVEIRIKDTGTGIKEEIRSKIFDPFFTTKDVGQGTGQGLAISHSVIVEKHRGSISFETELGQGTTFIIRLPLNQVPQGVEDVHVG